MDELKVVLVGVGAAGVAVSKMLLNAGVTDIIGCDREGAIYAGKKGLIGDQEVVRQAHQPARLRRHRRARRCAGADVFLGLSGPGTVSVEPSARWPTDAIVFAMANPDARDAARGDRGTSSA